MANTAFNRDNNVRKWLLHLDLPPQNFVRSTIHLAGKAGKMFFAIHIPIADMPSGPRMSGKSPFFLSNLKSGTKNLLDR